MVVPVEKSVSKQVFIILLKSVPQNTPDMSITLAILLQAMNHLLRSLPTNVACSLLLFFWSFCFSKFKCPEAFESDLKGK